jgi:hypothetical protein
MVRKVAFGGDSDRDLVVSRAVVVAVAVGSLVMGLAGRKLRLISLMVVAQVAGTVTVVAVALASASTALVVRLTGCKLRLVTLIVVVA